MNKTPSIIIDFDSTLIQVETFDVLSDITLKDNHQKDSISQQIEILTNKAMNGEISFNQALTMRLRLLKLHKQHIIQSIQVIKNLLTPSIIANLDFIKAHRENIYIISGGFLEIIKPVVNCLIPEEHIYANKFIYDTNGYIIDIDQSILLAYDNGKAKQTQLLKLSRPIYIIGDGYTDYEIKKSGYADKFFLLTENITRDNIVNKADAVIKTFDEFIGLL